MPSLAQRSLARGHRLIRAHYRTAATYQGPATVPDGAVPDPVATHVTIDEGEMSQHEIEHIGVAFRRTARILLLATEIATPVWQGHIIVADGPYAGTWIIRRVRALAGGDWEALCGADQQVSLRHESAGWGPALQ